MALTKATYSMIEGAVANVLDYGADPTGIAPSTTAFAAALASGMSVYVPQGTYVCGTVDVTSPNQTIFGDGNLSVITQQTAGNNLFFVKTSGVTIRDLRLNGIETSGTNTSYAIFTAAATPADYLAIQNVLISGASAGVGFNNAIKFDDNCDYGLVTGCTFERLWGNAAGRGYGVLAGNVTGLRVANNSFTAAVGRGRHAIYFSAGCSNSIAESNYVFGFDFEAITQYSTGAQPPCKHNVFANNTVINCSLSATNPFSGAISVYQHSFGCIIANNTVTGSGQKGIAIDGSSVTDCENTLVIGNVVSYSGTNGIDLTSTLRTSLIGNQIFEASYSSAGSYANIMLRTDGTTACVDTLIEGNLSAGSTYARSAITLDAGPPAPTLLKLQFNDFRPGSAFTVELNGVNGVEIDGRIQFRFNNVGYGPIANGASFVGPLSLPGALTGDICTASHTSSHDGCIFSVQAFPDNTGVLTIANLSGGSKTIASGTLRVDVWKRTTPF